MATLKTLVDETTNIKNKLKTCHANLKNNLIEKGVECSDTDKMSSLVDRVKNITSVSNVECGDDWRFFVIEDEFQGRKNTYEKFGDYSTFIANGGYRFFCDMKVSNGQIAYVKIVHKRNEEELFTQEISTKSVTNYVTQKIDISNIKIGDVVEFYTKVNLNNYSTYVKNYGLSCNINLN